MRRYQKPTGNKMVALLTVPSAKSFETNHAFFIESDSGSIELFFCSLLADNTVELKGEGQRIAEEGQRV